MASIVVGSTLRRQALQNADVNATLAAFHHPNSGGRNNPHGFGGKSGNSKTFDEDNSGSSGGKSDNGSDSNNGNSNDSGNDHGVGGGNNSSGGFGSGSRGDGHVGGDSGDGGGGDGGDNNNSRGGNGSSKDNDSDGTSHHGDLFCGAAFKPLTPDPRDFLIIQENDGRVKYGTGWVLTTLDPNGAKQTAHSTTINDSSVVVDFTGTTILVFGTVPESNVSAPPPSASYSIDGGRLITLPLPSSQRCIPNQQFFQSHMLPAGPHNLSIDVTTPHGTPYILDYFWVGVSAAPQGSQNSTAASSNRGRQSGLSRLDAVIVGSVLGAVFFLLALSLLAWFIIRRSRQRKRRLRQLNIASSPVHSWLHWQSSSGSRNTEIAFTSTESILRDNPSYSSTANSKDTKNREQLAMPITTLPPTLESPTYTLPPGLGSRRPASLVMISPDGMRSLSPPPWTARSRSEP